MAMRADGFESYSRNNTVTDRQSAAGKEKFRRLEKKLAKAMLICESMWEILRDEHGFTDKQLAEKIKEVDLRDGVADGKNEAKEAAACSGCGRNSPKRNSNCMYCGRELDNSLFSL